MVPAVAGLTAGGVPTGAVRTIMPAEAGSGDPSNRRWRGEGESLAGASSYRAASRASIALMSLPAMSTPNAASISRTHVGLVTLISVR